MSETIMRSKTRQGYFCTCGHSRAKHWQTIISLESDNNPKHCLTCCCAKYEHNKLGTGEYYKSDTRKYRRRKDMF